MGEKQKERKKKIIKLILFADLKGKRNNGNCVKKILLCEINLFLKCIEFATHVDFKCLAIVIGQLITVIEFVNISSNNATVKSKCIPTQLCHFNRHVLQCFVFFFRNDSNLTNEASIQENDTLLRHNPSTTKNDIDTVVLSDISDMPCTREGDATDTERQKRRVHWDVPTVTNSFTQQPTVTQSQSLDKRPELVANDNSKQANRTVTIDNTLPICDSVKDEHVNSHHLDINFVRNAELIPNDDTSEKFTSMDEFESGPESVSDTNNSKLNDDICEVTAREDYQLKTTEPSSINERDSDVSDDGETQTNESFPTDPYKRQQLISSIIEKYTKDMDQSYLMQRDTKSNTQRENMTAESASLKRLVRKNSKSLSPPPPPTPQRANHSNKSISTSSDEGINDINKTGINEDVFSLEPIKEKKSRIPVPTSRSPSRSPSHSRRSSVDSERTNRTRIPVSRSLSREKLEFLVARNPGGSRRGSTDGDQQRVVVTSSGKPQNTVVTGKDKQTQYDKERVTRSDTEQVNAIMRKYTMYNEEWNKPSQGNSNNLVEELVGSSV